MLHSQERDREYQQIVPENQDLLPNRSENENIEWELYLFDNAFGINKTHAALGYRI